MHKLNLGVECLKNQGKSDTDAHFQKDIIQIHIFCLFENENEALPILDFFP